LNTVTMQKGSFYSLIVTDIECSLMETKGGTDGTPFDNFEM